MIIKLVLPHRWFILSSFMLLCLLPACTFTPVVDSQSDASGNAGPVTSAAVVENLYGGYTSKVSVTQGESLDFHLSISGGSSATLRMYREGPTRQLMATLVNVPVGSYDCTGGFETGCDWPVATSFTVPANWPSGAYITTMTTAGDTRGKKFIFWVREKNPGSTARLLFLSSVNTHQAYNDFGGGSLYGLAGTVKSPKVSFNRPYTGGDGKYERWEAETIAWLERNGYEVEYATTYDLHFQPELLSYYDVAMVAGHSEYWTWDARQQLERFINNGGRFLNLAGNVMWWQIRYESNGRTLVGYRSLTDDPEKAANLSTSNPGDQPIFDNPLGLIGLYWAYGGYAPSWGDGYYAVNTNHWVFDGTGVQENQLIGLGLTKDTSLHDKESDGMPFNCGPDGSTILGAPGSGGTPGNFTVLGLTTINNKERAVDSFAMMGIYTRPGGGAMFSAGTTGWVNRLDEPDIGRITRNILDRFLAGNIPTEPDNPDARYFVYDRFNCHDVNRGRFTSTAWVDDIARNNFVTWTPNASGRLTLACGYAGSGLEFIPGPEAATTSYTLAVRPNWGTTETLYSHFYLKLDGLNLAEGETFNLSEQSFDDRRSAPLPSLVLQVRRSGNVYQLRYQPVGANLPWVLAPDGRFFLVETGWNRIDGRVGLWIDGYGYDEAVDMAGIPALNRFDLGVIQPQAGVSGTFCLDELILDGERITPPDEGGDPTPTPTPTPTPAATATATPSPSPTPTNTPLPPGSVDEVLFISSAGGVTAGGTKAADEDILALNRMSGAWSLYFDGSDVGLASKDIDAFQIVENGSLLISLDAPLTINGLGVVDDSDILRFVPALLGAQTGGLFELYLDGSDIGLTTAAEDIDAVGLLPDGDLLISTRGKITVGGITGAAEDLLRLDVQQTGPDTQGTWSFYFDGSDVGLTTSSENISAVWVDPVDGSLYVATVGNFSVIGLAGLRGDIFVCNPITTGNDTTCALVAPVYWSASSAGVGTIPLDGLALARTP